MARKYCSVKIVLNPARTEISLPKLQILAKALPSSQSIKYVEREQIHLALPEKNEQI